MDSKKISWLSDVTEESFLNAYGELNPIEVDTLKLFVAGFFYPEIAEMMDSNGDNVRKRVSRIYEKLVIPRGFKSKKTNAALPIRLILLIIKFKPDLLHSDIASSGVFRTDNVGRRSMSVIHEIITDESIHEVEAVLKVQRAIEDSANVNELDHEGVTPLFRAVEKRRLGIVNLLLYQADIDVNFEDSYGWTPLLKAANIGSLELVQALLEDERTDPLVTTHMKATAVYEAAFGSDEPEIVRVLEERGVNIEKSSDDRFTPLMVAIWRGNYAVADYLIENSSSESLDARDRRGETAFHKAIIRGNHRLVNKLLEKEVSYSVLPFSQSPSMVVDSLFNAAERGDLAAVTRFLNEFKDGSTHNTINNSYPPYKRTALHQAAENGHFEILKVLIDNGADIFSKNNHGRTPKDLVLRQNQHIIDFLEDLEKSIEEKL